MVLFTYRHVFHVSARILAYLQSAQLICFGGPKGDLETPPPLRVWGPELRKIRENTWKCLCLTGFTFNVSGDLRIHVLNEKIRGKRVFTYLTLNARISRLTRSPATKVHCRFFDFHSLSHMFIDCSMNFSIL